MNMPPMSLLEWQKRFGTEKACTAAIAKFRWPNGFICPTCGHDSAWFITTRPTGGEKGYQNGRLKSNPPQAVIMPPLVPFLPDHI